MISTTHLAGRLFNTPVALAPQHADVAIAALGDWFSAVKAKGYTASLALDSGSEERDVEAAPYAVVRGVAIIPVKGTLVQATPWPLNWSAWLGITGYNQLRTCIQHALLNSAVGAIAFDVDSPGGEVAGCFDLVDAVYAARGVKPMWSILSESAYSAAFAFVTSTDWITVPRTGGSGSAGVIWMHAAFERMFEKAGVDITVITKGKLKAETNPFEQLSDGAYDRVKADILEVGDLFDATVARNREMKRSAVAATEAGTFMGKHGVDIGFADDVMAPDAAFRALLKELG